LAHWPGLTCRGLAPVGSAGLGKMPGDAGDRCCYGSLGSAMVS